MNPNTRKLATLIVLCLISTTSACTAPTEGIDPPVPAVLDRIPLVSVTGTVVPQQEATLSLSTGGVVEKVLVDVGDRVKAGQVLLQLEGTESQFAAVSAAEVELVSAQLALEDLYKDTELQAAEALRSAEKAEKALEDLHNTEEKEALALLAVAQAEKAVDDTRRRLTTLTNKPTKNVIDQAYANMLLAEDKLESTTESVEKLERKFKFAYASLPDVLPNVVKDKITVEIRAALRQALKGLEIQRTQDQLAYDRSVTKYNNLLEPPDATDVALAEANYLAAQAKLHQAQIDSERVMNGPDAGDVEVLEAQIEKGYRDHETYRSGPDPDDIVLAEARVANADAQLVAAQEVLADLELTAPFDGVISDVYINTSEWVTPGNPVLLLADLNRLQVETTDLSEVDVGKIRIGKTAAITFDALPDLNVRGTITWIAPKADRSAGVNYDVTIELDEVPEQLRWGMTAFVDIEPE